MVRAAMTNHSAAEQLGEWLPHELAEEIRGLLADSPAALSPRLSAWLACKPNERCPQRGDRQQVQKRRLSEHDGAGLRLWSSQAAVARGTKWGASEEWMGKVFALLEDKHLKNARLVSEGWARQIISMKAHISISTNELLAKVNNVEESFLRTEDGVVQRVYGLARLIGRNRLCGLEALELEDTHSKTEMLSISFASLLTEAFGGCPLLKTLKLKLPGYIRVRGKNIPVTALQPLLPRLQSLHLSGWFESSVDMSKVEGLLSSMSSLTDLHLSCKLEFSGDRVGIIPGELLAVLPKGLTRLYIEQVEFDRFGLQVLTCASNLTDLTIKHCVFETSTIGLSCLVNLKSLSLLEGGTKHIQHLPSLSKLEHLCVVMCDTEFPEGSTTGFVQQLQKSLPQLTSLALQDLAEYNEGIFVALGELTGLTSLKLERTFYPDLEYPPEDDVLLRPKSLRHLTALKALQHLSLNGHEFEEEEERFLDDALPILQCLPSLVSLDVTGLEVTELNAPLFPAQLHSLGIGHGLPRDSAEETTVWAALAERCPSLTTVNLWCDQQDHFDHDEISFQTLAAVHARLPELHVDVGVCVDPPFDHMNEMSRMMTDLACALIRNLEFLKLMECSVRWNTPKHPWNPQNNMEPWIVAARSVICLCREIAAREYATDAL